MIPPLHTVERGEGPELVLVHGTATDSDGWVSVFAHGARHLKLFAYDRRGTPRSPLPDGVDGWTMAQHVKDLEAVLSNRLGRRLGSARDAEGDGAWVYGSSFGAIVVLELARRRPDLVQGILLGEPPLPPADGADPVPARFIDELIRLRAAESPEASGHFFLKQILSEAAYARMHPMWQERAASFHESILRDCRTLMDHPPRYAELAELSVPTLLLAGGRSGPDFPPVLDQLQAVLPRARRICFEEAGHLMHADQPKRFVRTVLDFMSEGA